MSALASMLGAEGLTVSWEPPVGQKRGAAEYARTVVELTVVGAGTVSIEPSARAAVAKFKQRFPSAGTPNLKAAEES